MAPLGAPITIVFNISSDDSDPINELTPLAFIPLFHSPQTVPTLISYSSELNSVAVAYNHAAPSLSGRYVLCRDSPPNSSNNIGTSLLERPQLCSEQVNITVTGKLATVLILSSKLALLNIRQYILGF